MTRRTWRTLLRGRKRSSFPAEGIPPDRIPHHVGIIMDGNGRWAKRRGLPAMAGHRAGTKALKRAVKTAVRRGVRQLSAYSFSTENWSRPAEEVEGLMNLVGEVVDTELHELAVEGVRVVFIGRRDDLSAATRAKLEEAEARTANNDRLTLYMAFNYGGRAEVVDAVRRLAATGVPLERIDEEAIAAHLYASDMRDPDLVIRTSGERRLSNFLLWQSAYSELYFSPVLWPDFDEEEFDRALVDYASRERRFGGRDGGTGA